MAEAVVSTALKTIRDLLIHEASLLSGIRDEVQHIQEELQRMQCFLRDADKRQYEHESVRHYVRSIRDLAYRAENVVETYAIKVVSREGNGIKKVLKRFACLMAEGIYRRRIGSEMVNIKAEITNLRTSLQTYGIKLESEGKSSIAANKTLQRQTFAHEVEEHFVGMQNDVDKLVSLMTDRDKDHRIISIYGMGGIGKTTLAKQVFNHSDVQNLFESFAWVTVSQECHPDTLLQQVLMQFRPQKNKEEIKTMAYRELVDELCTVQKEKKCVVVLDDIWKVDDWNILRHAFLITAVDCKVLLTTRIKDVAEIGFPHKLNLLSEEDGWQLLKKWAVTQGNAKDSFVGEKLEEIGRQIVHKCGRLPLAISVIGGVLSKKDTLEEWEMVNRDVDSYLRCGEGIEDNTRVMQILSLSYDDLPYQLKPCLLYFVLYPEDTDIRLKTLCWIWIAEGMVLSSDQRRNESLEEVAKRYLTELASRSLIQVQFETQITFSTSCRIHDLIRDLCLKKCKEEEFFEVMDFQGKQHPISDLSSLRGNAYRLAIYIEADDNVVDKILQEANENTRLYHLRGSMGKQIDLRVPKDLEKLQFLRVIAFQCLEFSNTKLLHKVIKKLIHVRYLCFIDCLLDEVPSSVGMLPYLQTFEFSGSEGKIPNVFWKLKRLMHFVLGCYSGGGESRILRLDNCLTELETLVMVNDQFTVEVNALSKLTNLRVFKSFVKDNESLSVITDCIQVHWYKIQDIYLQILRGCDFNSTNDGSVLLHKFFMCRALQNLTLQAHIRELPKYESGMLVDLVKLWLENCNIGEDPMPTLEKLPKLKHLEFNNNSFVGEELICGSSGFPNLTSLVLCGLPNLKKWRIDEGAMPNLSSALIEGCLKLEMIPDGMKFLKALRYLDTYAMRKEFNSRIRVINGQEGADFHKVRHVPSISISFERE